MQSHQHHTQCTQHITHTSPRTCIHGLLNVNNSMNYFTYCTVCLSFIKHPSITLACSLLSLSSIILSIAQSLFFLFLFIIFISLSVVNCLLLYFMFNLFSVCFFYLLFNRSLSLSHFLSIVLSFYLLFDHFISLSSFRSISFLGLNDSYHTVCVFSRLKGIHVQLL